jgi:EH_Signature domain
MRALLPPPVPRLDLPAWSDAERATWDAHTNRASALSRGPGTGRHFAALVAEARALLLAGDGSALAARLRDRRFVRAIATAWAEDAALARETMSPDLLGRLAQRGVSRLTTIILATFFFTHFDRLDDWRDDLFSSVRDLLRTAVASQAVRDSADVVEALRGHDAYLLKRSGPRRLAATLVSAGTDMTAWFRATQMTAHSDTRFGRVARDAFYLAHIEAADAEKGDHYFLAAVKSEVVARQRTDTTDEDGRYFGHQVLTALTAKTTRRPSTEWLQAVLDIGGDPRMAQTPQWTAWWSRVPEENLTRAIRWMRGVDLRAFLDGVEKYARATSNDALERMLERRKRLLVGLYEQDRVEDVRLILGDDIRRWINSSSPFSLWDAPRLQDSGKQDTAVIYVDCGDFCLVEGSHNFKLHIYVGGKLPRLSDRKVRWFDGGFFRETLPSFYVNTYGPDAYLGVAHLGGEWIRKALDFLRSHGVRVDERGLMTPNDYADLSRRRAREWY